MKNLFALFASVLLAASISANAQNVNVSGTVTDANGPVFGAVVKVKGTTNGTATDINGKYSITADAKAVLEVSCLGYITVEEPVNGRSIINPVLQEDNEELDEIIVVGYGTVTKRSLISSVSSINAEKIAELPTPNITQQLAGRTPGIIAKQSGGGVNKTSQITIRGGSTPLVVIDGIIRSYNDFVYLNPEDIENMTVLKDATATAVYGSRAANGIIQVTTKKGSSSESLGVNYSFQQSWSQPTIFPELMDVWDRAAYTNIGRVNDGMEPAYNEEAIRKMKDGSDPLNYSNTDWKKLILKDFAPMSKHQVTMQGGTKNTTFYMSLAHQDQKALYTTDINNSQRTNINLAVSNFIEKIGLRTTAKIDGYLMDYRNNYVAEGSYDDDLTGRVLSNPLIPAYNQYGLIYDQAYALTLMQENTGYSKDRNRTFNGQLAFDWALPWVKGLSLRATGNYRTYANSTKRWLADAAAYAWDSTEGWYNRQNYLTHITSTGYETTLQFFGEYKNTFGKHSVDILGGYESTYAFSDSYSAERGPFAFKIDQMSVGPQTDMKANGSEAEQGRAGWVFQAKYSYDDRYFIEGSMRYDGSDLFPKEHRWGLFYGGSVGWHLGNEAFMQNLKDKHVFDVLKLRASYGQIGMDNWGSPYNLSRFAYLSSYNMSTSARVVDGAYVPGFSEGALPCTDITWFTTYQTDAGFDFESLNHRLYGSFDWFYYRTTGFLYSPDPLKVGYTAPLGQSLPKTVSDGEHRREGFDLNLGWRDSIGDFTYDLSFNLTKFNQLWNVMPSESEASLMNPYTRQTQQTGYYSSTLHALGFYTSSEDVYNSVKRTGSTNLGAGDVKYEDFNGDGKIDGEDNQRLGKNSFPRAQYGFLVNLGYKGFRLDMLFQGASKANLYVTAFNEQMSPLNIAFDYQTDVWSPDNTNAAFPRWTSSPTMNGSNNYQNSDLYFLNAGYLRLKSLNFSYDFKHKLLRDANWIKTCRLSLSGTNLLTFSKMNKYFVDPENAGGTAASSYSVDRTFSVGVNIGF